MYKDRIPGFSRTQKCVFKTKTGHGCVKQSASILNFRLLFCMKMNKKLSASWGGGHEGLPFSLPPPRALPGTPL